MTGRERDGIANGGSRNRQRGLQDSARAADSIIAGRRETDGSRMVYPSAPDASQRPAHGTPLGGTFRSRGCPTEVRAAAMFSRT
jgi:hypothetical protein